MDFLCDEQERQLRQRLDSWKRRHPNIEHDPHELERAACQVARQLGAEGFMAYAIPSQQEGIRQTVQARDLCVVREELASHSALADVLFGVQALGSYPTLRCTVGAAAVGVPQGVWKWILSCRKS